MYLLAFETSFGKFSISLFRDGKLLETYASEKENDQAEQLMPNIEKILANHIIGYENLSYIAVGTGPGSFTGVRIGLAAAKGLSLGCKAKLIGVSSFEASAYKTGGGKIYLNASRGEAFCQELDKDFSPISDPLLVQYSGNFSPLPDSESIGRVAYGKLSAAASTLEPLYVRKPDAKFRVRNALASDLKELALIHSACFPKPWNEQMLVNSLNSHTTLFAENLGFIVFQNIDGEYELKTIAVKPDVQGKGVATYLMQLMLDNARNNKAEKIFLEVEEANARARNLYERFGFTTFHTRKNYYGENRHAILMQLHLQ